MDYASYVTNRQLLAEGGNVFKSDPTGRINRANVLPTVKFISKIIGVDLTRSMAGSTGKKDTSGDIDLIVDNSKHDKNQVAQRLRDYAASKGWDPNETVKKSGTSVHFRCPIVGVRDGSAVQVDLMFYDDPQLALWMVTNDETGKYKGAHRHVVLSNLAKNNGLTWAPGLGVRDRQTKQMVSTDPTEITKMVLGKTATLDDIKNIPSILDYLQRNGRDPKAELAEAEQTLTAMGIPLFSQVDESLFIIEGVQTKDREGIQHVYSHNKPEMYSMGFFNFKRFVELLVQNDGVISPSNSTTSEKIDGAPTYFGLDGGKFFLQSSYSGKCFSPQCFDGKIQYGPAKAAYQDNFYDIKERVSKVLAQYGDDVAIQAEWIYSPLALPRKGREGFIYRVITDYSIAKLGSWSTFALIRPIGAPISVFDDLVAASDEHTKFIKVDVELFPEIYLGDLVQPAQRQIAAIEKATPGNDVMAVLQSSNPRKEFGVTKKDLKEMIARHLVPVQKKMYNRIAKAMFTIEGLLGDIEGFVIKVDDLTFKINSPKYMTGKINKQSTMDVDRGDKPPK